MKKFFSFGKNRSKTPTPQPSPKLSKHHGSSGLICGYEIREKDLTKLHKAAWGGDTNKVQQLVKKDASPLDKENRTPLHLACARGHVPIVRTLLEWNAKTSVGDNMSRTPLLKAIECKQEECVALLLDHKADPNIKDRDGEGALHYAVRHDSPKMVETLLESDKIFLDIKNKDGQTPLHIAGKKRNLKIIEHLIDAGADINVVDNSGTTVLMDVAIEGSAEIVAFLLDNRADVNMKNNEGWTALDLANMEHHDDVVELITHKSGQSTLKSNKSSNKVIPPPSMYGGPAINYDDEHSEADGTMSKMSEAAGGLNSWNTDDDDESELNSKNQKIVPGLDLQKKLSSVERRDEASHAISARSDVSQPSGWSDDESLFSSTKNKKPSLLRQQASTEPNTAKHIKSDAEHSDDDSWAPDSLPLSARVETNPADKKKLASVVGENPNNTNMDFFKPSAVDLSSLLVANTQKSVISEQQKNVSTPQKGMMADPCISDDEDVIDPEMDDDVHTDQVAVDLLESGKNSVVNQPEAGDSDWDSIAASEISPTKPQQPTMSATNHSHSREPIASSNTFLMSDDQMSELDPSLSVVFEDEDVPMPHGKHSKKGVKKMMRKIKSYFSSKKKNKKRRGRNSPRSKSGATKPESPKSENNDDMSWGDSVSSSSIEPPPLPTEAPPMTSPPAVINNVLDIEEDDEMEEESSWEIENKLKKVEEEKRRREWEEQMEQQKLKQQQEAEEELKKEKEEPTGISITNGVPNISEATGQEKQVWKETVETREIKTTIPSSRNEHDSLLRDAQEERSHCLSEQRDQVNKEIAEIKAQQHVSAFHQSYDDEDTFHDVPDMDSPRKMDWSGNGSVRKSHDDDDCLSYSSTEHEVSILEDVHTNQHLTSFSGASDSTNVMRLQQQLRDTQQRLEKEKSVRLSLENKRKSVSKDREELTQKLEDVSRAKSQLEQNKIDMEASIRNLQYQLNEESEKRKNCEVLYNKSKEQLMRKNDQFTIEVESKQQSDLALRNVQMELRTMQAIVKQLEEEKEDIQRQLANERNARLLQEQINEEQIKFQYTINEDLNKSDSQAEMIEKMESMDETKKQAYDTIEKVKAELYATKMELERVHSRSKDDHELLVNENSELQQKMEDLKNDVKLNEEALAIASLKYNREIAALHTEKSMLSASLESEYSSREKLELEIQSLKTRLETASIELTKTQEARCDLERRGFIQQEDSVRQIERRDQELFHIKEKYESLQQRLLEAEHKVSKIENELHIANATLIERTNQLTTLQRDLDQRRSTHDSLNSSFRKEKEENARLETKNESLQERLTTVQHENVNLRQQLEDSRLRAVGEERDEANKFTLMLNSIRDDNAKSEIEEHLQKLQLEKEKLEGQLKAESQKVQMLQREVEDSHKIRVTLEAMNANLKGNYNSLQEKCAEASAIKTLAKVEADDNRTLWESEVKSRSKLSLRIAQLEREKQDVSQQLEEEKRRTRKAMELKKSTDQKLSEEHNRISELQKEVSLLKTHLKTAKKRLKEPDTSGIHVNSLHGNFDQERMEYERTVSSLRTQLEDVRLQLDSELTIKEQLEGKSRQLQAELIALRSMEKSYGKLDKAKRKMEGDLALYRSHMDTNVVEKTEMEKLKVELQAKARMELNRKLEEVNVYLEEQARARDKLDQMRDAHEAEMKREFERTRTELLEDVANLRQKYKELCGQKGSSTDEAKRFKNMYEAELEAREEMAKRLEKALTMSTRAQSLIDRQKTSGSIYGGSIERDWSASLSKPPPSHGSHNVFTSKIQEELDRSIAKHMEKGPHLDINPPSRYTDENTAASSLTKSRAEYMAVLKKNYFL